MKKHLIAIVVVLGLWGCESKETRLQSFLLKGNEALEQGDEEKALYYYNEALKLDPCFANASNNMGTVHHNVARYSEAIASYTKAIECDQTYYDARFNRANSYFESGEYYSALADIDQLIKT